MPSHSMYLVVNLLMLAYGVYLARHHWRRRGDGLIRVFARPVLCLSLVGYNLGQALGWWPGPDLEECSALALFFCLGFAIISQERALSRERDQLQRDYAAGEALRQAAESRIHEQAALLEASHDAILVWDLEAGVQFMNPAAEKLIGRTLTEVRAEPLAGILKTKTDLELRAAMQDVVSQGVWNGELSVVNRADQTLDVASRWTLLTHRQGKSKSILITCNDITEKKRLEVQYLRAQRLESVGTLASGIAHDLNNILSPILVGADMLKTTASDAESLEILDMVLDSARRGVDTVKQLLTFARGTEAQRALIQPRHLLHELVRLLQKTFPKNIQIYSDFTGQPALTLADPSQLHQVLMNLCVNARDAMPDGGILFLTLEHKVLDTAAARVHPRARAEAYLVFKVSDTGAGIPPEVLDRIFDPFFTTKPQGKGTGLGLATVLGIVENHGGFVLVESKPGQGATFQVHLPATTTAEAAVNHQPASDLRPGQGELILIVDDEPAILRMTESLLRRNGYQTLSTTSASEAIHLFERQRSPIRAVLTDIMMPFGDGRQLITILYSQDPKLPIIAMSGLNTSEFQQETLRRGAQAFISKPFSAEEILVTLNQVLKRAPVLIGEIPDAGAAARNADGLCAACNGVTCPSVAMQADRHPTA